MTELVSEVEPGVASSVSRVRSRAAVIWKPVGDRLDE